MLGQNWTKLVELQKLAAGDSKFRAFVIRHISNQEDHHRKRTFKEELIGLLEKHNIEYDKRYIWD